MLQIPLRYRRRQASKKIRSIVRRHEYQKSQALFLLQFTEYLHLPFQSHCLKRVCGHAIRQKCEQFGRMKIWDCTGESRYLPRRQMFDPHSVTCVHPHRARIATKKLDVLPVVRRPAGLLPKATAAESAKNRPGTCVRRLEKKVASLFCQPEIVRPGSATVM